MEWIRIDYDKHISPVSKQSAKSESMQLSNDVIQDQGEERKNGMKFIRIDFVKPKPPVCQVSTSSAHLNSFSSKNDEPNKCRTLKVCLINIDYLCKKLKCYQEKKVNVSSRDDEHKKCNTVKYNGVNSCKKLKIYQRKSVSDDQLEPKVDCINNGWKCIRIDFVDPKHPLLQQPLVGSKSKQLCSCGKPQCIGCNPYCKNCGSCKCGPNCSNGDPRFFRVDYI